MRRTLLACALLAIAPVACTADTPPAATEPAPSAETAATEAAQPADALAASIAGDWRSPENTARDQYRHPAETLAFFRVRPGMTVVDYMPSSGWYTRVLVPYLGEEGRYIGLNPDVRSASETMPSLKCSERMKSVSCGKEMSK